jgi:hypothetical protein
MEQNFIENEIIILTKQTLDKFLQEENCSELISLYTFYYYTSKWQKTNQPYCTDAYCQKGLHWGYEKFLKAKNKLIELGIIEQIKAREKGKFIGFYIKLNYIFKNKTIKEIEPVLLKPSTGKQSINALSDINLNALSVSKDNISSKELNNAFSLKNKLKKQPSIDKEFIEPFIKEWNNTSSKLPNKHNIDNISKTIIKSYHKIKALKDGSFIKKYNIPEKEIKDNNYDLLELNNGLSDERIKEGIKNSLLQFENNYYPFTEIEKSKMLPKTLSDTLYNEIPNTNLKSIFLKCLYNKPISRNIQIKKHKEKYPEIVNKYCLEFNVEKSDELIDFVNNIVLEHSKIINQSIVYQGKKYKRIDIDMRADTTVHLNDLTGFINKHICFLQDIRNRKEDFILDWKNFKVGSYWWKAFKNNLEKELDTDFYLKDEDFIYKIEKFLFQNK